MKKIVLGIALSLGLFSCSNTDEIIAPEAVTTAHSFEFNANTIVASTAKMSKTAKANAATEYVLTVTAINKKDGTIIETKNFDKTSESAQFSYKFMTSTGDVELKVSISPALDIVRNITFIPKNEVTKVAEKAIEFAKLPEGGSLTAAYNEETKEIKQIVSATEPKVETKVLPADFGNKLAKIYNVETFQGQTISEKSFRTFTYNENGKIISSYGYKGGNEGGENSVLVYNEDGKGDRVIKIENTRGTETSTEVVKYNEKGLIESSENTVEGYKDQYIYNEDGKITNVYSSYKNDNGVVQTQPTRFTYNADGTVTVKRGDERAIVLTLNDNVNPIAASIPAPFLKTISTDAKERYNVASEKSLEWNSTSEKDPNIAIYTYEKDAKGRVIKQTRYGKTWNNGQLVESTLVTYFEYMSK
jgi:hypothetical protein